MELEYTKSQLLRQGFRSLSWMELLISAARPSPHYATQRAFHTSLNCRAWPVCRAESLATWGLGPTPALRLQPTAQQVLSLHTAPCLPVYHLQPQAWLWLEELDGQCSIRKFRAPSEGHFFWVRGETNFHRGCGQGQAPSQCCSVCGGTEPQEIHAGRGNIHVFIEPQSGTSWVSRWF